VLALLTPREQKILRMRFGLEDGRRTRLEEVGQEFGVTRERIRQIEAKALAKLRKHRESKKLAGLLAVTASIHPSSGPEEARRHLENGDCPLAPPPRVNSPSRPGVAAQYCSWSRRTRVLGNDRL
jgi:hypothetical protein